MSDSSPTVPLEPRLPEPMPQTAYAAARKKCRWPWAVLVLIVLLGAAAVGGESWARASVVSAVRTQAIEALRLPADQQIDVQTEGLVLPQVLAGTLTSLAASSEDVPLGPIMGNVSANARDIPIRGGGDVGAIEGTIVIAQAELLKLFREQENLPLENIVVTDGEVMGEGEFSVLGMKVPVSVSLTLSVDSGDVMVTPMTAKIGGVEVSGEALRETLGGIAGDLLGPYRVCIAQYLPQAVTVTGIELAAGIATVAITVDGRVASDATLSQPGVCL